MESTTVYLIQGYLIWCVSDSFLSGRFSRFCVFIKPKPLSSTGWNTSVAGLGVFRESGENEQQRMAIIAGKPPGQKYVVGLRRYNMPLNLTGV
jgi:hypothetical protein